MADVFEIVIRQKTGTILVTENLDTEKACLALLTSFTQLYNRGIKDITIDFAGVEIINSYGVGRVLSFYRKLENENGKLRVSGVKGFVKQVFHYLMLDRIFSEK